MPMMLLNLSGIIGPSRYLADISMSEVKGWVSESLGVILRKSGARKCNNPSLSPLL